MVCDYCQTINYKSRGEPLETTNFPPMKKIFVYSLFFVGFVIFASGCSEKIEPTPLTYTKLLTGDTKKAWLFSSIIVIDDGVADPPLAARDVIPPCFADDQYVFHAGSERKFELTEGSTKCDPRDPDVYYTDSWTLINANAQLEFVFPVLTGQQLPYTIKTLTANTLVVELYQDVLDPTGPKISYRITFVASLK